MTSVELVPFNVRLELDKDFTNFIKRKLQGREIRRGKVLSFSVFFKEVILCVSSCSPEAFSFDEQTEVMIHEQFDIEYFDKSAKKEKVIL